MLVECCRRRRTVGFAQLIAAFRDEAVVLARSADRQLSPHPVFAGRRYKAPPRW